MTKFLKNFGLGLLLMIFSPLLVALVALIIAGGLIYFVFATLRGLVRFFMGLKWFKPLEIDNRVKAIKEQLDMAASYKKEEPAPAPAATPASSGPVYVQNNYYNSAPPTSPVPPPPSFPEPTPSPLPLNVHPENPNPNPAQISQTPSYPYDQLTDNINDDAEKVVIIRKEVDE